MADAERFHIEGKLASGGMGTVFKARDTQSNTAVALKILHDDDDDSLLRFAREAEILADLDHPGIVKYIAHGNAPDGRRYLAMDWVDGETLHTRLSRTGITIVETIALGRRIADALDHAHARGIVHRDIKPTNLIARRGDLADIAVVDFGIARVASSGGSLTETGALVGTPSYMAPEQARGDRELGAKVDVFALGCVLYECLTGQMTFEGTHVLALIAKVVLWEPPPPLLYNADVPRALDALIVTMIAKDPEARPSAREVATRLAALPHPSLTGVAARRRTVAAPTIAGPRKHAAPRRFASLVVATDPAAADGAVAPLPPDAVAHRRTTLASALAGFDVRVEVLYDGSILVIVANARDEARVAACAVRCARVVRAAHPHALVAVATSEIDDDGDLASETASAVLDVTVKALAKDAMALVFANLQSTDRPPGAIRIDDATAKNLQETVVRVGRVAYLSGS